VLGFEAGTLIAVAAATPRLASRGILGQFIAINAAPSPKGRNRPGGKYPEKTWPSPRRCSVRGRIPKPLPRVRSALERPHSSDPMRLQEQRRTGAGGFVRSAAQKDDFAVSRNPLSVGEQLVGGDPHGPRYEFRTIG